MLLAASVAFLFAAGIGLGDDEAAKSSNCSLMRILIFSSSSNMEYDSLVMLGSGSEPQLPESQAVMRGNNQCTEQSSRTWATVLFFISVAVTELHEIVNMVLQSRLSVR